MWCSAVCFWCHPNGGLQRPTMRSDPRILAPPISKKHVRWMLHVTPHNLHFPQPCAAVSVSVAMHGYDQIWPMLIHVCFGLIFLYSMWNSVAVCRALVWLDLYVIFGWQFEFWFWFWFWFLFWFWLWLWSLILILILILNINMNMNMNIVNYEYEYEYE